MTRSSDSVLETEARIRQEELETSRRHAAERAEENRRYGEERAARLEAERQERIDAQNAQAEKELSEQLEREFRRENPFCTDEDVAKALPQLRHEHMIDRAKHATTREAAAILARIPKSLTF